MLEPNPNLLSNSFSRAGRVLAFTAAAWIALVLAMLGGRAAAGALTLGPAAALVLKSIVPALVAIGATVMCEARLSGRPLRECWRAVGFRSPRPGQLRVVGVALIPIALAYVAIFTFVRVPFETEAMLPLLIAKYAIAQGIAEEVLFRGFAFRHLRVGRTFGRAALLSAVIFAAVHLTNLLKGMTAEVVIGMAISTVYAFVLAFPFALLFERGGGSLAGVSLLHFAIDSNNWFPKLGESAAGLIIYVFGGTFAALGVTWWLTRRWLPVSPESTRATS
jgi:membrane protease YdiL (CAAX protease family)